MIVAAGLVLALDQFVKAWVADNMASGEPRVLVDGVVRLRYTENTGAAFGLFQWATGALSVAATAIILAIIISATRTGQTSRLIMLAVGLVVGGALGNLTDRLRLGYVVDFIDLYGPRLYINNTVYTWPVFNIADSAITVGVILLMAGMLLARHEPSQAAPPRRRGYVVPSNSAWLRPSSTPSVSSIPPAPDPDQSSAGVPRAGLRDTGPVAWAGVAAVMAGYLLLALRDAARRS